jgi:hypothetical protein
MEKLSAFDQQSTPYENRVYYHGISGRRLQNFLQTGEIPNAQQAFGGLFSITDDYELAKSHAGKDGVVLLIKVNPNTHFESSNPFEDDYFPEGDICDIGEAEFIVNNPKILYSINVMKENVNEEKLKEGKSDGMSPENIAKKMKALAGIAESDKKFLKNLELEPLGVEKNLSENDDKRFVIIEFEQEEVEPGDDDDKLYKLK